MTDRRADDDAPVASEALAEAAAEAVDPLARAYLGCGRSDLAALADARGAADFAIAIARLLSARAAKPRRRP